MNLDEAMSEAILGARVTCDAIGEGVYVAYNFGGWRIHHGDMASSGFAWRDEHKEAEWRIVEPEQPKPNTPWGAKRIVLGEHGVPAHFPPSVPEGSTLYASTKGGGKSVAGEASGARQALARRLSRPNVGTAAPLTGFELARLEAAKEAEPLPEPPKPASPWGKPKSAPWGKPK